MLILIVLHILHGSMLHDVLKCSDEARNTQDVFYQVVPFNNIPENSLRYLYVLAKTCLLQLFPMHDSIFVH